MSLRIIDSFIPGENDQLIVVPDTFLDFIKGQYGPECVLQGQPAEQALGEILSCRHPQSVHRLYFTTGLTRFYCLFIDNKPFQLVRSAVPA